MFKFLSRSSERRSASIRQALVNAGLSTAADPARVTVVETKGNYSGRPVKYFRAFEPGHEEFGQLRVWSGGTFHAEEFDVESVNEVLRRMKWPVSKRK